jgi:hypothetical protein
MSDVCELSEAEPHNKQDARCTMSALVWRLPLPLVPLVPLVYDPLCRRQSRKYPLPTSVEQQLRDQRDLQQQQQELSAVPAELPDLQQLFPGDPCAAIHALVQRQCRISQSKLGVAAGDEAFIGWLYCSTL